MYGEQDLVIQSTVGICALILYCKLVILLLPDSPPKCIWLLVLSDLLRQHYQMSSVNLYSTLSLKTSNALYTLVVRE